ncbi:hypothetical protein M3181_20365 [Mesobacillus maritimus]|uniref:hypothetical protein n=1 Tax=Mesobacillus maritimus TaxID=1643336 RepID=UPI00203A9E41|nr:hypothetical protein [Mesobacillus maritimus]MCM3671317.1 hypothetical protein [Mesobacillus maritimus]
MKKRGPHQPLTAEEKQYYDNMPDKTNFLKNDYYALKQGNGYTSPPSSMPAHELKMLKEYMHQRNTKHLGDSLPEKKKTIVLIRFLKEKRNQQVKVRVKQKDQVIDLLGRVSAVGRDFVAITTVTERYWLPYSCVESANVPYGVPDMPNSHQQVVYDEELRRKLLMNFSTTVLNQDVLKRQFYEESLVVHLQAWKGTKVKVYTKDGEFKGKISTIDWKALSLKSSEGEKMIPLGEIQGIKRSTPFLMLSHFADWVSEKVTGVRRR